MFGEMRKLHDRLLHFLGHLEGVADDIRGDAGEGGSIEPVGLGASAGLDLERRRNFSSRLTCSRLCAVTLYKKVSGVLASSFGSIMSMWYSFIPSRPWKRPSSW